MEKGETENGRKRKREKKKTGKKEKPFLIIVIIIVIITTIDGSIAFRPRQNVINEDFSDSPLPSELDLVSLNRDAAGEDASQRRSGNTLNVPVV